jgi:hypothetical protein
MESRTVAKHKSEQLIETSLSRRCDVVAHVISHQPTNRLIRGAQIAFEAETGSNASEKRESTGPS